MEINTDNKEPFLLSPYQMAEIKKLTEELEDIHATVKKRNNHIENVLGAFEEPIKETRKYVYHVSGFKPFAMFDILFGKGLKWNKRDRGIFYNVTEYVYYGAIFYLKKTVKIKKHVSLLHSRSFYGANGNTRAKDYFGRPIIFAGRFSYLRRFGIVPIILTYEIDTRAFKQNVYEDPACKVSAPELTATDGTTATDGVCIARYIPQERIPSKYIKLKAISFTFPWLSSVFGDYGFIHKVLWRRR